MNLDYLDDVVRQGELARQREAEERGFEDEVDEPNDDDDSEEDFEVV